MKPLRPWATCLAGLLRLWFRIFPDNVISFRETVAMPDTAVATSAIPPVPLKLYDEDFQAFSARLGASFERYGFAVLGGHGIDPSLLARVDKATKAFFALPEDVKLQYHRKGTGGARGYTPFGVETAKGYTAHDLKEFYHIGRDLPAGHPYRDHMADNIWPAEVADFHEASYSLYMALDNLGRKVLQAIAVYLKLDRDFFADKVDFGNSVLRLLHYPPVDRPGESVRAGAALLTLQSADAASAKASLAQARAQTALAQDALRRQNEMVSKGVGLEVERFQAQVAVREARAELERAERAANLLGQGAGDRFVLRAPAAGVVLSVRAATGAVVAADGAALVEIGDPSRLWVVADVPESEAASIRSGAVARIHVPGAGGDYAATVDGIGPLVDSDLRRLPLYLKFAGERPPALTPGSLVEVRLDAVADAAPSVPVAAVLIKGGSQRVVYVQRGDGRFEARAVRTGASRGGRVTVLDGVRAGEKVVVEGALLLDSQAEQLL